MHFHGIIPPVVTPMLANEDVDLPRLCQILDRFLTVGVHGLFVLGTTGEFYAMSESEKQSIIAAAVAHTAKRVPVIAGTGAETTRESIRLTKLAERENADAVAVITPYFINPTQSELYDHYRRIAESTKLPVFLYANPVMAGGNRFDVATVARLSEIGNIIGMKDSAGDLTMLIEYVRESKPGFAVFQGRDTLIEPALVHGAAGAVPGCANIAPEIAVEIYNEFRFGNFAAARAAQARLSPVRLSLTGTAPGGVKAAMNAAGIPVGPSRSPVGNTSR